MARPSIILNPVTRAFTFFPSVNFFSSLSICPSDAFEIWTRSRISIHIKDIHIFDIFSPGKSMSEMENPCYICNEGNTLSWGLLPNTVDNDLSKDAISLILKWVDTTGIFSPQQFLDNRMNLHGRRQLMSWASMEVREGDQWWHLHAVPRRCWKYPQISPPTSQLWNQTCKDDISILLTTTADITSRPTTWHKKPKSSNRYIKITSEIYPRWDPVVDKIQIERQSHHFRNRIYVENPRLQLRR